MKRRLAGLMHLTAAVWALQLSAAAQPAESGWVPERNVELVVPTSPGSAQDHLARLMQSIWQSKRVYAGPSTVVNKPGVVAADYMVQRAGDPHLLYMGSAVVLSNHITGKSTINYSDMTPIVQLFGEYIVLAVNASSPIRTAREFLDALKKDRNALSIALATSRGNTNHIAVSLAAKSAGIDPKGLKIVLFRSGGECVTALLGGHVDAVSLSAGTLVEHVASGKMRALAISAPRRMGGAYAAVPTWNEVGAPSVASNWRSVLGTKGIKPAEVQHWEGVLSRTVQTDEWKRDLDKRFAVDEYLNNRDSIAFLDEEYAKLKAILTDLGLAK
jgi:putative tricarboxylic transport membrane protein